MVARQRVFVRREWAVAYFVVLMVVVLIGSLMLLGLLLGLGEAAGPIAVGIALNLLLLAPGLLAGYGIVMHRIDKARQRGASLRDALLGTGCPHCGLHAFSPWTVRTLPGPVPCPRCGQLVDRGDFPNLLVPATLVGAVIAACVMAGVTGGEALLPAAGVTGTMAVVLLLVVWATLPLVRAQPTDDDAVQLARRTHED